MRIAAWFYVAFVALFTLMAGSAQVASALDAGQLTQMMLATAMAVAVLLIATKVEISIPMLVVVGIAAARVLDVAGAIPSVVYLLIAYSALKVFSNLAYAMPLEEVSLS